MFNKRVPAILVCAAMSVLVAACDKPEGESCATEGLNQCSPNDNTIVQVCKNGYFQDVTKCNTLCVDGKCVSECSAGMSRCDSNLSQICINGQWVNQGSCLPDPGCTSGATKCNGQSQLTCSNGVWMTTMACAAVCGCVEPQPSCQNGTTQCSGQAQQTCSNGTWVTTSECSADCGCGACTEVPSSCVKGTSPAVCGCDGNAYFCGDEGTYYLGKACDAANPCYVCDNGFGGCGDKAASCNQGGSACGSACPETCVKGTSPAVCGEDGNAYFCGNDGTYYKGKTCDAANPCYVCDNGFGGCGDKETSCQSGNDCGSACPETCEKGVSPAVCGEDGNAYFCGKDGKYYRGKVCDAQNVCNVCPDGFGGCNQDCSDHELTGACEGEIVTTGGHEGSCCDVAAYVPTCINEGANALVCSKGIVKEWTCANNVCSYDAGTNKVSCEKPTQEECAKTGGNPGECCDETTYIPSCLNDGYNALVCYYGTIKEWGCVNHVCSVDEETHKLTCVKKIDPPATNIPESCVKGESPAICGDDDNVYFCGDEGKYYVGGLCNPLSPCVVCSNGYGGCGISCGGSEKPADVPDTCEKGTSPAICASDGNAWFCGNTGYYLNAKGTCTPDKPCKVCSNGYGGCGITCNDEGSGSEENCAATGGNPGDCCVSDSYTPTCINGGANALICSSGKIKQWTCANSQCSYNADTNKVDCPKS